MSPTAPRAVTRRAHAKINVFLRVLRRRDDGFHDIETVVLPISLHDVVTAEVAEAGHVSVQVDGDGALTSRLPGSIEDNLAGRAIVAMAERAGPSEGASVLLDKRIPVAAGLGGGSADAAATVLALRELWHCDLDAESMTALAAVLGSDVPALLAEEPVLAEGRGERLTPVHAATTWWVLRPLGLEVSAAEAYGWWDEAPTTGPDAGVLIAALETGDVRAARHRRLQRPAARGRIPSPGDRSGDRRVHRGGRARGLHVRQRPHRRRAGATHRARRLARRGRAGVDRRERSARPPPRGGIIEVRSGVV